MMTMKSRKNRPANVTIRAEVCELGNRLSFLDVLSQACGRNARYTLTVDGPGVSYTVLVDRGGPFNATGGGTTGSPALVHAAQLRTGRCSLTPGWPMEQPMYQPGLDMTLKALVNGAVEPTVLPPHRGVDSLRNAEFRDSQLPLPSSTEMFVRPADMPSETERLIASLPSADVATRPVAAPSPAPAAPAPAPATSAWNVVETAPPVPTDSPAPNPATPQAHEAHEAAAVETARRMATRALLWMVEVEDGGDAYSLKQAASLAGRGLVDGIAEMVHPLKRDIGNRVERVKAEWEKSGEVAAQKTRKSNSRRISAVGDFDPDHEFRLR